MHGLVPLWQGGCIHSRATCLRSDSDKTTLAYHQPDFSMPRTNLVGLLDSFVRYGGDPAVVQKRGYRREKQTYAELRACALLQSCVLSDRGIGPGDRVLLWGANSAEWIACFWAIQLCGAIGVPMDAGASLEFVRRTVRDAGVKLILRDRGLAQFENVIPSLIFDNLKTTPATRSCAKNARTFASRSGTRDRTAQLARMDRVREKGRPG